MRFSKEKFNFTVKKLDLVKDIKPTQGAALPLYFKVKPDESSIMDDLVDKYDTVAQ